ncbi:MAG: hypothetical protein JW862_17370 [Anaerolineales bacterium]|nr:hypothetical protein [Anaerolineales bacterium]
MKTFRQTAIRFLLLGAVLAVGLLACDAGQNDPAMQATVTALSERVLLTSTAAASGEDDPNARLATAQAEATQQSQQIQATQTALAAGLSSADQLATATVQAPLIAELPRYGVDPQLGRVGWVHPPVTLEVNGYQASNYANDFPGVTAADFVMAADITWDSQYSTSGCGFMFRSDGDAKFPNQYMVLASRGGNGHVSFLALADGELANWHDFYAGYEDPGFDWRNQSTNRLVVVARGTLLEIFTNGTKIGEVDVTEPPAQITMPERPVEPDDINNPEVRQEYEQALADYEELIEQIERNLDTATRNFETKDAIFLDGFTGMLVLSESGYVRCDFSDAWLWIIEE